MTQEYIKLKPWEYIFLCSCVILGVCVMLKFAYHHGAYVACSNSGLNATFGLLEDSGVTNYEKFKIGRNNDPRPVLHCFNGTFAVELRDNYKPKMVLPDSYKGWLNVSI